LVKYAFVTINATVLMYRNIVLLNTRKTEDDTTLLLRNSWRSLTIFIEKNRRKKERKNEKTKERKNERTKKRKNERKKERKKERKVYIYKFLI
jgi:hypothetical protein